MEIILNDLLLAFSTALDSVEESLAGATSGHSRRVAALSCKMAESFGMSDTDKFYLIAAAALHDNALTEFIRDEIIRSNVEEDQLSTFVSSNLGVHCVMGERNVSKLSFYPAIKDVILYHHEQADGKGPFGKKPDEIPLFARIIHFADICDVNFQFCDMDKKKYEKLNAFLDSKGRALFDDEIIAAFKKISYDVLGKCSWDEILYEIPSIQKEYNKEEVHNLAQFFAKIIDYKSPFTCLHSMGIADKAKKMSQYYGWDEDTQDEMYLAGALHDVGKLMVDNAILHKPGKLTEQEYGDIQNHAMATYEVLSKMKGLEEMTAIASHHHEKLDGSGYPFQLTAKDLSKKERVMMVLDIYQALREPRPYKDGMSHEKAMSIINGMVEKGQLDQEIAADVERKFRSPEKILVVLTGGTIGSRVGNDAINVNSASAYNLIHLYNKSFGEDTEFEVIQPMNVLSENMTPTQWGRLILALEEIDFSKYQGIIITHGSDTLAYTAALLGMIYGSRIHIPMMIVAANYALEDTRSNGLRNFRGAVSFIKQAPAAGVFIVYEDDQACMQVYLATRLVEADCYEDQFKSYGGKALGEIKENVFVANETDYNPTRDQMIELQNGCREYFKFTTLDFTENIVLIHSYPGLNYDIYNWDHIAKKPAAILVSLYHSATACVESNGSTAYSLAAFTKRCQKEGIDVYAVSFKSRDMKFYASSKEFLDAGVIPMYNISVEAAYMKLQILYNQKYARGESMNLARTESSKQYVCQMLNQNLFFEHLPEQ